MDNKDIIYNNVSNALMGFAVGDAMGVPIEFTSRSSHSANPLTEMVGYGSHYVPEGTWSDDTSMTIAGMDSIREKGCLDYYDIMNKYCEWAEDAKYTATDQVFDIGIGTRNALSSFYRHQTTPTESGGKGERDNGNGSLMRMIPLVYYMHYHGYDGNDVDHTIRDYSSLTHGHEISHLGCRLYYDYMHALLEGKNKEEAFDHLKDIDYSKNYSEETIAKYSRILDGSLKNASVDTIQSSGFVVSTLEASLWSILKSNSFEDAVVTAINLGDDTDTVGAITGSMAGTIYGKESIPERWISRLRKKDYLDEIAKGFSEKISKENTFVASRFLDDETFNHDQEVYKMVTGGHSSEPIIDKKSFNR